MPGGIHPPLTVIASWPQPNYDDPVTKGWTLVVLTSVLYGVACIAVAARLWARLKVQKNAGLDDLLIVFSMIPALGLAVSICLASKLYGFDRHVWDIRLNVLPQSRQITFAIECFYVLSTSLTRLSILCFYHRMAQGSLSSPFLWSVRIAMGICVAYAITFEFTLFLGCWPFNAFWRQVDFVWLSTHEYHCINEAGNLFAASFLALFQDLLACLLPMMLFWKMQLPLRQKITLGAIFGLGGFLCVAAILRIYYIHLIFYETYDVTWASHDGWAWTAVEALLGISCASAPALKILVNQYLGSTGVGSSAYSSRPRGSKHAFGFGKIIGCSTGCSNEGTMNSGYAHRLEDLDVGVEEQRRLPEVPA